MRCRRLAKQLLALATACAAGCSLFVDASDIDEGCAGFQKVCVGECVDIDDPAFGCKPDACQPCSFNHAIPACAGGQCVVDACLEGFGCDDCSKNILTDESYCGGCEETNACKDGEYCENGECVPK